MNPKRRSELQRKLSLNAVPRPPEGLAERIKADIPKYLEADTDRGRFSRSIAFNMRIAASIMLLVTSLIATVYLVSPQAEKVMTADTATPVFAPAARAMPRMASTPTDEVRLEITQESKIPEVPAAPPASLIAEPRMRADEADAPQPREEKAFAADSNDFEAGNVAVGMTDGRVASQQAAEFAPQATAAAPASAPPPPPAARKAAAQETITVTAGAPALSIMREAHASKMTFDAPGEVFGISIDPAAFQRIRATLENGDRPASASVDVEALVNHFAATAASTPPRGVRLEVEASPAAIEADGDHAILRFTVDTARPDRLKGGSTPPIAADARIEVEFTDVVKHASRVGGSDQIAPEAVLLSGTSVTGLYEVELRPNLTSKQTIAVVRLHYKSVPDGRRQTITRTVKAGDLARSWSRATRRHRLASLGALWGETLKGTAGGDAVAQRAEELATQKPDDPLARDLARAAHASAGGR